MDTLQDIFGSYSSPSKTKASPGSPSGAGVRPGSPSVRPSQRRRSLRAHARAAQQGASMQREIIRIHELWQKAKRELGAKEAEAAEWKERYQRLVSSELSRTQARKFQELESMTMEFKDKLRFMELQLNGAREENERWGNSYEEVVRELEKQKAQNREQASEIERLSTKVRDLGGQNESLTSKALQETRDIEEEVRDRERTITLQDNRITTMEAALARMREERDTLREQLNAALRREESRTDQVRESKRLLSESEESLQYLRSLKLSEQQLKVQVEHLKLDNGRMVRLLTSTSEYAYWQEFVDDSGGVSYLPTRPAAQAAAISGRDARLKQGVRELADEWADVPTYESVYGAVDDRLVNPKREREHWVPEEALRLSVHFRHQYLPHVPPELISEYLRQLNEAWRVRESNRLSRLRKRLTSQLRDTRRKAKQSTPYDVVMLQKQLQRSQEELAEARQQLARGGHRGFGAKPRNPKLKSAQESHVLEASLASVENLSRQLASSQHENRTLRSRLQDATIRGGDRSPRSPGREGAASRSRGGDASAIGGAAFGGSVASLAGGHDGGAVDESAAFLDGCRWLARNASAVLEELTDRVAQLARRHQEDMLRLSRQEGDTYLEGVRLQNAFVDAVEDAVNKALGRVRGMQGHAAEAQGNYDRFLRSVRAEEFVASPPPASAFRSSRVRDIVAGDYDTQ